MKLEEFYALLLPAEGFKFVATHNKYFTHHPFEDLSVMAEDTAKQDAAGKTVYFACAAYAAPSVKDGGKTVYRTQGNVLCAKALWWDIDCGPNKDYPDQAAAIMKLHGFCAASGVPVPMLVSSGNGVHCYWPLETSVDQKRWKQLAGMLHNISLAFGFKMDHSRSRDMTSVLRPIDTYNRKSTPKKVEVISEVAPFENDSFIRGLLRCYKEHVVTSNAQLPASPSNFLPTDAGINADLNSSPARVFPESNAERVAEGCAQIAHFRDTGSDNEPHWRNAACTIKFCKDGEAIAHAWSSKYPDYDQAETQSKLDRWTKPPPFCETFNNYNGLCDKCPSKGKITQPIQLGYEVVQAPDAVEMIEGTQQEIPFPFGFELDGEGRLTIRVEDKKAKIVRQVAFCDIWFYLYARFRDVDGVMSVGINARIRQKASGAWEWKKFTIPTSIIGAKGRELRAALAQFEIVAMRGKEEHLEAYVQAYLDLLRRRTEEVSAYRTFGNQADGSILVGSTLYCPDGETKEVLVNSPAASNLVPAFHIRKASPDKWMEAMRLAYDHPDHQQFQFPLLVSLGSVLIEACGIDTGGAWNLYGERGKGKTTACEMALSAWGDPKQLSVKWGKGGTTDNAFFSRVSAMHSLPFLLDEVTNITAPELSALVYQLQSGRTKEVLGRDRKLVAPLPPWRLMGFMTSNSSLLDIMSTGKDDASAEMTRALEIQWRGDIHTLPKNDMAAIQAMVDRHAGAIGREWAALVAANRDSYREVVMQFQRKFDTMVGFGKEQRYWSAMTSAALAAGFLAEKNGLLPYAFKPLIGYAVDEVKKNMACAVTYVSSTLDSFHRMVTALSPVTISTEREGDARADRVPVFTTGEPAARIIRSTGEMYISIPAIREWCTKRQVGYAAMRDAVANAGILVDADVRFYIGKGTDRPTGQLRCWKLDWGKLQGD